jgi:hypothetical protein
MSDDRLDVIFTGLEPPPPPAHLREASLRAARAAFAEAPVPDVWTRLVRSPAARIAWAASVMLLVAANLLLPAHPRATASVVAPRLDPEIAPIAHLPRIDERALAARQGVRS